MRPFWIALALLAVAPPVVAQEATVVSEPEGDLLLSGTRAWSILAGIGDLRAKPLGADDIELRVWGGYGLVGTRGAVLRRIDGVWDALTVYVEQHAAATTDALARAEGLLPPCVIEAMADRCEVERVGPRWTDDPEGGEVYLLECPLARPESTLYPQEAYAALWADIVEAGVRTLPPEIEREWMMTDGHSYVVELREGGTYRASSLAHAPPEVEADAQVQAIARRLSQMLGLSLYPYWDDRAEGGDE